MNIKKNDKYLKMIVKESLTDILAPKTETEKQEALKQVIEQIKSISIREDAIEYVDQIIKPQPYFGFDIKDQIINSLSDKEFEEALIHVLKDNLNLYD